MAVAMVDAAVYEGWVREYLPPVHRYLRRRADRNDVDDLAAEVFTIAWRRRDDVPDEAVLPWLYRTAHFVLANHRRARRDIAAGAPTEVAAFASAHDFDVDDVADVAIEDATLAAAWATLSAKDQRVLMLAAWEGLNGTELGEALGMTAGGAGAALHRARQRLAQAMAGTDVTAGGDGVGVQGAHESAAPERT